MNQARLDRVAEFDRDARLRDPSELRRRIEVLERLETHVFALPPGTEIRARADALAAELETLNAHIYAQIRGEIRAGKGSASLVRWLPELTDGSISWASQQEGYDSLDEIVSGVLNFPDPGQERPIPASDSISYQPTPVRLVFDLCERTGLGERDAFVDIGCGLGQVSMLTAICTGARSIGIDAEPAYIAVARTAAASLGLTNVTFLEQDARSADFSGGTVFYLYTPFTAGTLRTTLDLLRREARHRAIRICSLGPCTAMIATEDWLKPIGDQRPDRIAIFASADSD